MMSERWGDQRRDREAVDRYVTTGDASGIEAPPGPIVIRCEGSGGDGVRDLFGSIMCRMCGVPFDVRPVPDHDRKDIIAMVERGDFG